MLKKTLEYLPPLVIGLITATIFFLWIQPGVAPHMEVTLPVMVRSQDAQGGQFALGVSRAMNWAARFGLDEFKGKRIRPLFLDEDELECPESETVCDEKAKDRILAKFLKRIDDIPGTVPLVVGPLTSTHAATLLKPIAGVRKKPMILGIPTNSKLQDQFAGRVWRLSPSDDFQAKHVVESIRKLLPAGGSSLLLTDVATQNIEYSKPLGGKILKIASETEGIATPDNAEVEPSNLAAIEQRFKNGGPPLVIYAGMPEQARILVDRATQVGYQADWIFTDGCVDPEFIEFLTAVARSQQERQQKSRYFITFQAPPANNSKGIRSYIWFTKSMGGQVTGVVDHATCDKAATATSYEVFGFDSYMIALNLIHEAGRSDALSEASVEKTMRDYKQVSWPFLLMAPYEFDKVGNNTRLNFHLYEVTSDGCISLYNGAPQP